MFSDVHNDHAWYFHVRFVSSEMKNSSVPKSRGFWVITVIYHYVCLLKTQNRLNESNSFYSCKNSTNEWLFIQTMKILQLIPLMNVGNYMLIRNVRKWTFGRVRPVMIQISLRIAQSDLNLHWAHFGYLRMQHFNMRTTETLIRLCGCAFRFESFLSAQQPESTFSLFPIQLVIRLPATLLACMKTFSKYICQYTGNPIKCQLRTAKDLDHTAQPYTLGRAFIICFPITKTFKSCFQWRCGDGQKRSESGHSLLLHAIACRFFSASAKMFLLSLLRSVYFPLDW